MKIKALYFIVCVVFGIGIGWIVWGDALHVGLQCPDGARPDVNGCCQGEVYTDMGDQGYNCCPDVGDCFPPIK